MTKCSSMSVSQASTSRASFRSASAPRTFPATDRLQRCFDRSSAPALAAGAGQRCVDQAAGQVAVAQALLGRGHHEYRDQLLGRVNPEGGAADTVPEILA